jgi:ABC-2 type transport system ATP-binding protein
MDEAEYCSRLGIMYQGQLLAIDTPDNLKQQVLNGSIWEVEVTPLMAALTALSGVADVLRVGLFGDRLRVVTRNQTHTAASLQSSLKGQGFEATAVIPAEPTLEDVFVTLVGR